MKKITFAKYASVALSLATVLTAVALPLGAVAQVVPTGSVIVIKQVVNDNGGTATPANFTLTVNGSGASTSTATTTAGSVSFPGSALGTTITLNAGASFSVTESDNAGYTPSFSGTCSGTIAAGETRVCTVTNNDIVQSGAAARLTVVKQVINSSSTSRIPSDFTVTVNGTGASLGSTTSTQSSVSFGGSSAGTVVTLTPGSFSVTESPLAGFTASFSAGCSGTLGSGETRTCVVTNTAAGAVSPTLTCSPSVQTVQPFQTATITASGGNGSFTWSAPDITITNPTGSTFRVTYFGSGTKTVTVASAGQIATCNIIVSGAVVLPPPGLPDTGEGGNASENTIGIFGLALLLLGGSALLVKRLSRTQ